jgi:dTDP-4-amino-4,6-dideoxygalactose transaminase
MTKKPIFVTEPFLPPLEEYTRLLREIWDNKIFTHNGPFVKKFEKEISKKLKIRNFISTTSGTTALQIAIKSLGLKGEVITTPFSWIATISAIKCEGCVPVFCDIEPDTFNIDPNKIEKCITDKTVAIVPVHSFGNPCDIDAIDFIAKKYNLKVVYDAAHSIGSTYKNKSILDYGNISATSLHCTKLINTAEGGGCITTDKGLHEKIKRIRFFGYDENKDVVEDGLNGKMTEIHAALGLANLKYYDKVLQDRKNKYEYYKKKLSISDQLSFQVIKYGEQNYSYFPVLFKNENNLLKAEKALKIDNIHPRRYFYPSLNTFNKSVKLVNMPISTDISKRILCLPLYWKLEYKYVDRVIEIILNENND